MEASLRNRQSIRLKSWDYSRPGWYFVTVCTQDMRPVFGTVVNGWMALNEADRLVREMWLAVGRYHPEMERAVFRAALASHRPVIRGKPWAHEERTAALAIQTALADGSLLILSPFAEHEAPSARQEVWCTEYVMRRCDRLVLGGPSDARRHARVPAPGRPART